MAVDQVTLNIRNSERAAGSLLVVSAVAPVVDSDAYGTLHITAQAAAITSVTVNGTPQDGQILRTRIKDNGTNRAITWGAQFAAAGVALPTTTTTGQTLTTTFVYDAVAAVWGSIASVSG